MSLNISPHLFYARVDPRRRTHAVGIYTHMLDRHGIVYNQPLVLNERQARVAIEGVLPHNESRDDGGLLRLSVDTHGYTSVGMAVSKLLCVRACAIWRSASCICRADLPSPKDWRRSWPTTFRTRQFATAGMSCCGSSPRFSPAAHQLGKLLRTLFLCDYFSNVAFRRELHTLLNRGEAVHQLQRAIYTRRVPPRARSTSR
ncbi:hypothetical protein WS48_32710 [Burkholderia sp. RF7-non_BP1]|nr:hypothetical protein WS48_32710 [Burkholderia sp. RF7-non_BP1]KUZ05054.1 hypothetical protein WS49_07165 [Burkholderia sp. RF7-non_BP4]